LKLDHQLNQLVLAQALQISPFHEHMDSEIALRGKGVGKYQERRLMRLVLLICLLRRRRAVPQAHVDRPRRLRVKYSR
jgi:hypothetical protein